MDVCTRITELREKRGYTVNKLANLAGISQSFLREIEMGMKKPGIDTLSYICDALNVSLRDFFTDEALTQQEDELRLEIAKLSDPQRSALLRFLKSMQ
ncbi:MAG: helix-turn-helix transcriptional regulator [Peptococcaceae bacterium]|nr:helix-turn-helix transcriptional regulator [Peptococcaceae bacterium]